MTISLSDEEDTLEKEGAESEEDDSDWLDRKKDTEDK